eukprot:6800325-Pyramimonas_sp.AAC.1
MRLLAASRDLPSASQAFPEPLSPGLPKAIPELPRFPDAFPGLPAGSPAWPPENSQWLLEGRCSHARCP